MDRDLLFLWFLRGFPSVFSVLNSMVGNEPFRPLHLAQSYDRKTEAALKSE